MTYRLVNKPSDYQSCGRLVSWADRPVCCPSRGLQPSLLGHSLIYDNNGQVHTYLYINVTSMINQDPCTVNKPFVSCSMDRSPSVITTSVYIRSFTNQILCDSWFISVVGLRMKHTFAYCVYNLLDIPHILQNILKSLKCAFKFRNEHHWYRAYIIFYTCFNSAQNSFPRNHTP